MTLSPRIKQICGSVVALVVFLSALQTWKTPVAGASGRPWLRSTPPNIDNVSSTTKTYNRTIIIHVGPHKHGTTYLQCILSNPVLDQALLQDSFVYFGRHVSRCYGDEHVSHKYPVKSSMGGIFTERNDRIFDIEIAGLQPKFVQALDDMVSNPSGPQNAFVVSEDLMILSPTMAKRLVDHMHQRGWAVRIVLGYRPHYEYLPSLYSQRKKPGGSRTSLPWPDEPKGKILKPFDVVGRDTFSAEITPQLEQGLHKSFLSRTLWSLQDLQGLEVIDMSNLTTPTSGADPLLHHFLCHSLVPHAPHACAIAADVSKAPYSNPTFEFSYDLIAVEAHQRGWFPSPSNATSTSDGSSSRCGRLDVIAAMNQFQASRNQTARDFMYMKCLSPKHLDVLWKVSLHADGNMFGTSSERTEHLKRGFDRQMDKKKFCHVDAARTLDQDQVLREFLQTLSCS